jgi:hypothetical protein
MTRIIVDETLRSKLHNLSEPLELCDESGLVLARLTPLADLSQYEPWEPPISEEELRRREQSDTWHTTEQVLAHLVECSQMTRVEYPARENKP